MRTITRLAGWTFGWVVANQVAFFVVLALADGAAPGAVSAYTYAYTFFLLPYGVVAVSVMSAVTPSLSARWALRDVPGFRHRMAFGLRGILAVIIPSAVGMLILARPLIDLVLLHGAETSAEAEHHRGHAGHVRPRPAGVLHVPLHGPGVPVHAGHPDRIQALPGGERAQHRARPWCWSARSESGASPSPCPSPTRWRRWWPWPWSDSGWGAWGAPT